MEIIDLISTDAGPGQRAGTAPPSASVPAPVSVPPSPLRSPSLTPFPSSSPFATPSPASATPRPASHGSEQGPDSTTEPRSPEPEKTRKTEAQSEPASEGPGPATPAPCYSPSVAPTPAFFPAPLLAPTPAAPSPSPAPDLFPALTGPAYPAGTASVSCGPSEDASGGASHRLEPGMFQHQYHVYGTGRPRMNWTEWVENLEEEPQYVPMESDESEGDRYEGMEDQNEDIDMPGEKHETYEEWEASIWSLPSGDREFQLSETDDTSKSNQGSEKLLTSGTTVRNGAFGEAIEHNFSDSASDTDEEEHAAMPPKTLTQLDIIGVKVNMLSLLPAACFLDLPQVRRCLNQLSKDEIVDMLTEQLDLGRATGVQRKTIHEMTVRHPDPRTQKRITSLFCQNDELRKSEMECDFLTGVREMGVLELRRILTQFFLSMSTAEIYQALIQPRTPPAYHTLELIEMYGSAVTLWERDHGSGAGGKNENAAAMEDSWW